MRRGVGMSALVIMVAVPGLQRVAWADETTTCDIDSWGALRCVSTSSSSSPGPTGPRTPTSAAMAIQPGLLLIASIVYFSSSTDHGREIGLGVLTGGEMFPAPEAVFFSDEGLAPEVKARWRHKTTITAKAWGSAVSDATKTMAPVAGGRIIFGKGRVGFEASGESAADPKRYSDLAAHLLLRAPPRNTSMIALAIGASRTALGGQVRTYVDVFVPHEYILSHDDDTGAPDVLLGLRPGAVFSNAGVDLRFDLALVVPIAKHVALEVGGGAFSFDSQIQFKGAAGLSLGL